MRSEKQTSGSAAPRSEEAKVRALLEAWASAVRGSDLDAVVAHHSADVVYFDVPPPVQVRGISAYRDSWPAFFEHIGGSGQFELSELTVTAGDDVAFAHAILLVRGASDTKLGRVRLSVGLRKIDDQWTIVHEHHSAPYEAA
jgi:ketosteroid isomerase-like protein